MLWQNVKYHLGILCAYNVDNDCKHCIGAE